MIALVEKLILKAFAQMPVAVSEIRDQGKANIVFRVELKDASYVLRLKAGEEGLDVYQREQWCAEAAREAGVPTPKIITVGTHEAYAYSFQEYVAGTWGKRAEADTSRIWRTLGQYASKINTIPASSLAVNYAEVLDSLFADDLWVERKLLTHQVIASIKERLTETASWDFLPMLCHGNLHPSNVVIDQSGAIQLIDWGSATGNRVPHGELSDLYTWNTGKENIGLFLEGYGMTMVEVGESLRDIQTLVLLRLVSVLRNKVIQSASGQQDEFVRSTSNLLGNMSDFQKDLLFTKNI